MTKREIKDLFSRFNNLNLVFLIEDVRRGLVLRGDWIRGGLELGDAKLCPIAHGWICNRQDVNSLRLRGIDIVRCLSAYVLAGLEEQTTSSLGSRFVQWWDSATDDTDFLLHSALKELIDERRADADAYQALMTAGPPPEDRAVEPVAEAVCV